MIIDASYCMNSGILESIYIIKKVLDILFILAPVFVIITTMISLFQTLVSDKKLDDVVKTAITKIAISGIIIFIPLIVTSFVKVINNGEESKSFLSCYENATKEKIEYYKNKEAAEQKKKISDRKTQEKKNQASIKKQEEKIKRSGDSTLEDNTHVRETTSNNGSTSSTGGSTSSVSSTTVNKNVGGVLYIGDSRTVGMYFSVYGGSYSSEINITQGSQKWLAKVGSSYNWFQNTAVPYITNYVKNGNYTVTIQMGANDLYSTSRANSYVNSISNLAASYPNSNFVIISVNPVNDSKAKNAGYQVTNSQVISFNNAYKSAISSAGKSNISYCDVYSSISSSFSTSDGLHYDNTTNKIIYNRIGGCI